MNDLGRQTESMREQIRVALAEAVGSGWYVLGPQVAAFEAEFAAYCGVRTAISVANGTDALELALRALGCGPGSEVITVANAGMYATAAILSAGAQPVFADIDPDTLTLSPEALSFCISENTAAIVVTHLYGRLADIETVLTIAAAANIPVVEDCAQSHGAERSGRRAGSFGTVGCFSFYPTKNLGALGDGGALVTNDERLAGALRSMRQYGWREKYKAEVPFGRNSRLDEMQAAILRAKLPRLDAWNARRREIIGSYRRAALDGIVDVQDASGFDHVGHLCVVRTQDRDALRAFLSARGIGTDIHYPIPDYRQPALAGLAPLSISLLHTEAATAQVLSLPCFPEMTRREVTRVCDALASFERDGGHGKDCR